MNVIHFSVITPSRGDRPKALALAMASVAEAAETARSRGFDLGVEMLVGFDGRRPEDFVPPGFVRHVFFPKAGNFGNAIRHALLKAARGERVVFLDDDNALTPEAFCALAHHPRADLVVARIDTSRAFREPLLPRVLPSGERIAQGNVDPLCICVRTDFARVLGRGWEDRGGYESDFLNILRYYRRARHVEFIDDVIGVYDAGRGLDPQGANARQQNLARNARENRPLPSAAPWRGDPADF